MAYRGKRGGNGAAALFAARMTDEVEPDDDEIAEFGLADGAEPADEPVDDPIEIEEPEDEPEPAIDYSHAEDESDDDPEPEPKTPDALADLQAQLAEMKAERDAEKARNAVNDEAVELRQHQTTVASGLRHSQNALANAKKALSAASAASDWDAVADAQVAITQAVADVRDFEAAADEVRVAVDAFNKGARRAPATLPAAKPDQFEAAISTMSDKSKDWCRTNKADLTKSPARGAKAHAAHLEAVDTGLKVDTPEYFRFLDKQMGFQTVTKKTPKPTGRAHVAAPVGGRGSGANGGGSSEVKLSRDEVAMAKQFGMSVKEYAAQKSEIIRNGKDPSRGGPTYSNVSHNARR